MRPAVLIVFAIAALAMGSFVAARAVTVTLPSVTGAAVAVLPVANATTTAPAASSAAPAASSTAGSASSSALQAQIDSDNAAIAALNKQIADYQQKLQQIGSDKKTLQAAINALDLQKSKVQAQVSVTLKQINATQLQIQQIGSDIVDTEATIAEDQKALGVYLQSLQKADDKPLIMQLLGAGNITDAWKDATANLEMQKQIQDDIHALQAQRGSLAASQAASQQKKATLASQQQALTAQQQSLSTTVQQKSQLLTQTKAQESNYQKLLAEAEAQLESFSAFTQNAGGSKLLAGQTICDSWGCYYNQRDTQWGNLPLNGTKFKLASDGCLVTSMAMVMTHYGYRDVTPVTINLNPDNFASYYPAYLLMTISVDGLTVTRKTAAIDATLAGGNPLVVGVHAYGGTHFIVLVSGAGGHYVMRDPYVAGGKDIDFASHYSVRNIFSVSKVNITKSG